MNTPIQDSAAITRKVLMNYIASALKRCRVVLKGDERKKFEESLAMVLTPNMLARGAICTLIDGSDNKTLESVYCAALTEMDKDLNEALKFSDPITILKACPMPLKQEPAPAVELEQPAV